MGKYNKDRKEFNNKLANTGSNNDLMGIGILIQGLIVLIGGLIYAIYRLYKYNEKHKNNKSKTYTWMGVYAKK